MIQARDALNAASNDITDAFDALKGTSDEDLNVLLVEAKAIVDLVHERVFSRMIEKRYPP